MNADVRDTGDAKAGSHSSLPPRRRRRRETSKVRVINVLTNLHSYGLL